MEKEVYRRYLENISDYLNVWSICSLYNEKYPSEKIDYTNLKAYATKEDIKKVSGIGESKYNKIKDLIEI